MNKYGFIWLALLCANTLYSQNDSTSLEKASKPNCVYEPVGSGTELVNLCDDEDLDEWELVFSDDFNGPTLDNTKWISGYGWANYAGEALYRPENITFPFPGEMYLNLNTSNVYGLGVPWMEVTDEIILYDDVPASNGRLWTCTSGAIRSKRTFKYGKFEIRCWLPDGDNYFPAFWLFGGPAYSEVDIFEFKGQYDNVATNMYHNGSSESDRGDNDVCDWQYKPLFKPSYAGHWHTYGLEWDKWKLTFFVDGEPIRTVYHYIGPSNLPITSLSEYLSLPKDHIRYNKAYPSRPMHLIANLTVNDGKGEDVLNGNMKIDYIRAWSKHSEYAHLDIDSPSHIYKPEENHRYSPNSAGFENLVEYVHESENSDFADGHGGDFNGDGKDEFVSIRNVDGHVLIHEIEKVGDKFRFKKVGHYKGAGPESLWSGISCGDVDNDGFDEIVAIRNLDAHVYIWDVNYVPTPDPYDLEYFITAKCVYDLASPDLNWSGVECGDFDEDGIDEIALVSGLNEKIYFWEYDISSNEIVGLAAYTGFGIASDFADLTAGDFNGDGRDEVAVVRNYDGNLYILELNDANVPYVRLTYDAPSPSVQWTSITAGRYKDLDNEQIVIHGKLNNLITMVDAVTSVTPVASTYACTIPVALGSGFFDGDCEQFIAINNFGEYELKSLPGYCFGRIDEHVTPKRSSLEGDVHNSNDVLIYPNPTNNWTKILFDSEETGSLFLMSLDGKILYNENFENTQSIDLDMADQEKGVYLIELYFNDRIIKKRIIKK